MIQDTNALGQSTTYFYQSDDNNNGGDNPSKIVNPAGEITCYTYTDNGQQASSTYPAAYNANQTSLGCGQRQMTFSYNPQGGMPKQLSSGGVEYNISYPTNGQAWLPTQVSFRPQGTTTDANYAQFTWTPQGSVDRQTNADNVTTDYDYDAYGNVIRQTVRAVGQTDRVTTYTYDAMGRTLTMVEPDSTGNAFLRTDYTYDALGRLLTVTRLDGLKVVGKTEYSYDQNGNQTMIKSFIYDTSNGQLLRTEVTTNVYDNANRVISTTQPNGSILTRTYDFRGNVLTETLLVGTERIVTRYQYNAGGQLIETVQQSGSAYEMRTVYQYDLAGRQISVTDPHGVVTSYAYQVGTGRLLSVAVTRGTQVMTTSYEYDTLHPNRRIRETLSTNNGADGIQVIDYQYDTVGRSYRTIRQGDANTEAIITETFYMANSGRVWGSSISNESGSVSYATCSFFDTFGQVAIQVDNCDPSAPSSTYQTVNPNTAYYVTRYTYYVGGQVNTVKDDLGALSTYTYNVLGQMTRLSLGDTNPVSTNYTYDSGGRTLSVTDPTSHQTVYQLTYSPVQSESIKQLGEVGFTDDITHIRQYDQAGRVIASIDPNNRTTTYSYYVGTMLLKSVTNPAGETVTYEYSPSGLLKAIIDGMGRRTEFECQYDCQTKKLWPLEPGQTIPNHETYQYDGFGRLIRSAVVAGACNCEESYKSYKYDVHNRVIEETFYRTNETDFERITTRYNVLNKPTTVILWKGPSEAQLQIVMTTTYGYDGLQRVTEMRHTYTDGRGTETIKYTYFIDGSRRSLEVMVGTTVIQKQEYAYNNLRQLVTVTDVLSNTSTTYVYHKDGMLETVTTPNRVNSYTYDVFNRVTRLTYQQDATAIATFSYTYDKAGNRTCMTEDKGSVEFVHKYVYDQANRLTTEQRFNGTQCSSTTLNRTISYQYDDAGNRIYEVITGLGAATVTYSYNRNDQLLQQIRTASNVTTTTDYTYDRSGRLITKRVDVADAVATNDVTTQYSYDLRDQLTGVSILPDAGQNTTLSYAYNASGRRIAENLNGTIKHFQWDELTRYGDVVSETNSAGNAQVRYTMGNGRLISQTRNATTHYFIVDAMGTTHGLASASGMDETYTYSAFGKLDSGNTNATRYLYTGQQYDTSTGLYHLRARNYDPSNGRFLSRDVWPYNFENPVELNRYVYAMGNPVNYSDPSGYTSEYGSIQSSSAKMSKAVQNFLGRAEDVILGMLAGGLGYYSGFAFGKFTRHIMDYSYEEALSKVRQDMGTKDFQFNLVLNSVVGGLVAWANGFLGHYGFKRDLLSSMGLHQIVTTTQITTFGGIAGIIFSWFVGDSQQAYAQSSLEILSDLAVTVIGAVVSGIATGYLNLPQVLGYDKYSNAFVTTFVNGLIAAIGVQYDDGEDPVPPSGDSPSSNPPNSPGNQNSGNNNSGSGSGRGNPAPWRNGDWYSGYGVSGRTITFSPGIIQYPYHWYQVWQGRTIWITHKYVVFKGQ
ncbi:MAG: hypothetical protein MUF87_15745 [Anaerolineae bacterium]|nr:hypothetical protein [Anaerolineae bacterium]